MKHKLVMFYARDDSNIYSGQRVASEMLANGLIDAGYAVEEVYTPTLNRQNEAKNSKRWLLIQYADLLSRLARTWFKEIAIAFTNNIVYVNPGQSTYGLLREGLIIFVRNLIGKNHLSIVALHGSTFLDWQGDETACRIFRSMLCSSRFVVVLGPTQSEKLIKLGIPKEKIKIIDNGCLIPPLSEAKILEKHSSLVDQNSPIQVLYLSFLMESKGYVEFIEAIQDLASNYNLPVRAYICGKIRMEDNEGKFRSNAEAKQWIENQIERTNQSKSVSLNWINGVFGQEKTNIFHTSHIFVFPSRFKNEAQPISMIEALASGCAVITTKLGEIPTTVNHDTALFISEGSSEVIAEAIYSLVDNRVLRSKLAVSGLNLFHDRFSYRRHIDQWEVLLKHFN
jgi:glycosyltransferase involved in cell wall biosynthesis